MSKKVGFLTIGQSPREDVVPEICSPLGASVEAVEAGALDGLLPEEIARLKPTGRGFPLVTRLRDGSSAVVGRNKIIPRLQAQVQRLEKEGAGIIALLCTDEFPEIQSRKIILRPSRILFHTVAAVMSQGKLAVVAPLREQQEGLKKKWERAGLEVCVLQLNPYLKPLEEARAREVAGHIVRRGADGVALDCIGYTKKIKDVLGRLCGKPVLLPRSLLARILQEIIG